MKFLVSLLLSVLLTIPAQAGESLVFSYMGGRLSHGSLAVLTAAYAKIGIEIKGEVLPAARALVESNAGRTDGEVHRIEEIETLNPNLIRVKAPINTLEGMAVTCGDSIKINGPESLNQYAVGIKTGQRYAEKLTQDLPNVTILPDVNTLFTLLKEHRLDVVICDRPWALLEKDKPSGHCLNILDPPLVSIPLFHYLHKRHKGLVPVIDEILQMMEISGESAAIRKNADATYEPSILN